MATFREHFRRKNRSDREGREREAGEEAGAGLLVIFHLAFSIFRFLYARLVLRASR